MRTTFVLALSAASSASANILGHLNIACNSFGIPDGYQGHAVWRARGEHCDNAIANLMNNFGQIVPSSEHGCTVLAEDQTCEVSICDDYNVRRPISYETVWAAAEVVHARHRDGGTVAGYVSLDDYNIGGEMNRAFVMVKHKDTPDPSGKRKRMTMEQKRGLRPQPRSDWDEHAVNRTEHAVPNTNDINVNMQARWGPGEWMPMNQMERGKEYLLNMWNDPANDQRSDLRAPAYWAWNNQLVDFEFAANQFNAANALDAWERRELLSFLLQLRGQWDNPSNYVAQIRRGTRILGIVIIRVFGIGLLRAPNTECG